MSRPPPNTITAYYLDTADVKRACNEDFKKIDKACEQETTEKNNHPVLRKMLSPANVKKLDAMTDKIKGSAFKQTADNGWMSHCDGLWVKPSKKTNPELVEFNKMLGEISTDLTKSIKNQIEPLIEKVTQEIKDKAIAEVKDKAKKAGVRGVARWGVALGGAAVGGVGAVVTEAGATIWNLYDWGKTAYQATTMGIEAYGAIKEVNTILGLAQTAQTQLDGLIKNTTKSPTALMAETMAIFSRLGRCTRARRCLLVPYKNTRTADSLGGKGCCPGQTGHHVLPDEMVKNSDCPGYEHDNAPTVCVEGTGNGNGSHKMNHDHLAVSINRHTTGKYGDPDSISYGKARDQGIASVQKTFPESKCDTKCLKAQLDEYYKEKCKKDLKPLAGTPKKPPTEEVDTIAR